jgi:threonine/homoserine/homoserine lactone efflux protein
MGAAIGQILGFAVGVAISPVPIIALILMLFSNKATANSLSFTAGWLLGLLGAGLVVLALGLEASSGEPSDTSGYVKIAIGVLFFFLGWKQWKERPTGDEEPQMPGWMASIEDFSAVKALGVGLLLSAANPKNLGLTIAAAATIGASGLDASEEFIVLVVFVLLASMTILVPVGIYLIMGSKATPVLTSMKEWLIANNNTVMMVLFVVLGAKLLGDGISIVW